MRKTIKILFHSLAGAALLAVLIYSIIILWNLRPIRCDDKTDLGQLLRIDLTNADITDIKADIDYLHADTTMVLFLRQNDFTSCIRGYHPAAWLSIDNCEEPVPPGDLRILEECGILPQSIEGFGYSYCTIVRGVSEVDYSVRCYQIGGNSGGQAKDTYIVITYIPRVIIAGAQQFSVASGQE